ncbi:hypothetical protein BDF20DRAFT_997625 [Mycotypha africana]|uniref:uncharacterized protein n=1 Tax=Mycotypha africana TaxID=64632 RepID=UPI002300B7D0|nr:uncharacterized protein BDF20DRAFT_997625 [Mycotypha africana]KAI8991833.1 hypothetical protein BDF20DRAFT_997625 [Mycotypha africana]
MSQQATATDTKKTKKKSSSDKKKKALAKQQQQQALQQQQQQQSPAKKDSKMPKLRLDINLEAEVYLKAKAHGDVTLTLLS